jgi:hypothetical protein
MERKTPARTAPHREIQGGILTGYETGELRKGHIKALLRELWQQEAVGDDEAV